MYPLVLAQLSDPLAIFHLFAKAVMAGSVPAGTVLAMVVVGFIFLVRWGGPKLEAILPDHTMVDKALQWLFKSKPGGWLINSLVTAGGALATFIAAAPTAPVTFAILGPILAGTFTIAGIWEFIKDTFIAKPAPAPVLVPPVP